MDDNEEKSIIRHNEIIKRITNWKIDTLEHLNVEQLQLAFNEYMKASVYNDHIDFPFQKIWLITPKMKVFRPIFPAGANNISKGVVYLALYLYIKDPEIKKFYLFIKKLERQIKEDVMGQLDKKRFKYKSPIKKSGEYLIFRVKMQYESITDRKYKFNFHIYNKFGQRMNIDTFTKSQFATCIIELKDVWVKKGELGFNWYMKQMLVEPEADFSQCLFPIIRDERDDQDNCYHCEYCPNKHVQTIAKFPPSVIANMTYNQIPAPPPTPLHVTEISVPKTNNKKNTANITSIRRVPPPSLADILSAKGNLKSTGIDLRSS